MTKALVCIKCADIISPFTDWRTNRNWRWCQCGLAASRWEDGDKGFLQVTSAAGPSEVRVLGLHNSFLSVCVVPEMVLDEDWRTLHQAILAKTPSHFLFSPANRNCWAVVIKVGQTGDVVFVPYNDAVKDKESDGPDEKR